MKPAVRIAGATAALIAVPLLLDAAYAAIGAELPLLVALATVGAWVAAVAAVALIVSAARQGGVR